jgi:hypothetical protein
MEHGQLFENMTGKKRLISNSHGLSRKSQQGLCVSLRHSFLSDMGPDPFWNEHILMTNRKVRAFFMANFYRGR